MSDGFLGCGDVTFQRKVNGVWGDWGDLGDATKFLIKENAELKERKSKRCESYGQNLSALSIKQPAEIEITLDSLDVASMALLFLGEEVARSVAGGTVTDEPHTINAVGNMIKTENANISAVDVKDATGTTSYSPVTDFTIVNAKGGFIKILEGGAISSGDSLLIDYTNGAITSNSISGGTKANVQVRLQFNGKNLDTQEDVQVDVHEAVLTPQGGLDFLNEDFAEYDLGGKLNFDTVQGNSYAIHTGVVNA